MKTPSNNTSFYNQARETMDPRERKKDLNTRFLQTLAHVLDRSSAYRERYGTAGIDRSAIQSLEDIEKLPLLRMTDLMERQRRVFPFGGFETLEPKDLHRIYVNPGLLFQPGGAFESQDTSWAQALCGAGFKAADRIINTFNYHLWPFARIMEESAKNIGATVIPAGAGNTMMQVKIMQMLEVNGFLGTPSFLTTLAQRAEAMGLDLRKDVFLETALVSAEMLPESLRARLQEKFDMTVRQAYGTVFLGCIGFECGAMTGLHVPDSIWVEIVDPGTGRQVADGSVGEIVATNFSRSYPMIRMATGDLSCLSNETCPCGRTGPLLKKIIGRMDQATKVGGLFVHPWQADEVMARYPEVFKYQLVITRKNDTDLMRVIVELKEDISETLSLQRRMEREIEEMLGVRGSVQIVPRGTLPDRHRKIEDQRKWE
jgi:phenylacetate-coenzyme A ligase PaaK-like adenylate-forming protein